MDDLISRQAAIDEVVAWLKDSMSDGKNGKPLTERLKDLPAAQQAKTAEWLPCNDRAVICSSCGAGAPHMYSYCNYCGAWMRNHDRKYDV